VTVVTIFSAHFRKVTVRLILVGDHAAQDNTAKVIHMLEGRFEVCTSNVLEVDVNAVWTVLAEFGGQGSRLFIAPFVKPRRVGRGYKKVGA
jgi:hypothetical protein